MGMRTRRSLVVAGVRAVIVMATVTALVMTAVTAASASTGSPGLDPSAATSACAQGRAPDSRLGASDVAFLARFVPCVLRYERAQFGLKYVQNPTLSRLVAGALDTFEKLPYLSEHHPKMANAAGSAGARLIARNFCLKRGSSHWVFQFAWGDTSPPPSPTPLAFATNLVKFFPFRQLVARRAGAVFGVATARGLLFRRDDRAGAAIGVVDVICQ